MNRIYRQRRGFTLTESIIIFVVVGILTIIAAPSFGDLLASIRLKEAVTEFQVSLSQTQRQAIRTQDICEANISTNQFSASRSQSVAHSIIDVDCNRNNVQETRDEKTFDNRVIVATNILPLIDSPSGSSSSSSSQTALEEAIAEWCEDHKDHGHDDWEERCLQSVSPSSDPKLAQIKFGPSGSMQFEIKSSENSIPNEPAGKLVLYQRSRDNASKKCIVVSRRLGLTRVGTYEGGLKQKDITENGCTAKSWTTQT